MRRVFICTPYGSDPQRGAEYARGLCDVAIRAGMAPFAPHLLYPRILGGENLLNRARGIACGLEFLRACEELWYFTPTGYLTTGMAAEIHEAEQMGIPVINARQIGWISLPKSWDMLQ